MPALRRFTATLLLYVFGLQSAVFAHYPLGPLPAVMASPAVVLPWVPLATGLPPQAPPAAAAVQDLRQWTVAGVAGEGQWQPSSDGVSTTQKKGGTKPTLLVSPADVVDTTLRAKVKVLSSTRQDDFIGLAFAVKSPLSTAGSVTYDLWLVDWKAKTESASGKPAKEGWTLSRLQGAQPSTLATFWKHQESANHHVLARKQGSGKGWCHDHEYDLELSVRSGRMKLRVDGETIFDVVGSFTPGRFALYAYSQPEVRFRDVTLTASNGAPAANAGADKTLSADNACRAAVTLDGSKSTDPDGDPLTYTWTGPFGTVTGSKPSVVLVQGLNAIELAVSDGTSTSSDTVVITVADTTPPSLSCPAAVKVTAPAGQCTASGVVLGTPTSSDNCGGPNVSNNAPALFGIGTTNVTWSAVDGAGLRASCTQKVTVADPNKPTVSASVAHDSLWPPNHKLEDVGLKACANGACAGLMPARVTVFSDEPHDCNGDGHTDEDAAIEDGRLLLRPERSGQKDGRVYLILVAAGEAPNVAYQCTAVTVPKSQSAKDLASAAAQAKAAVDHCNANGSAPQGFRSVTTGSVTGTPEMCGVQNAPPQVNAGADQTIELPTNEVALDGTVTDDGKPAGGTLTSQWTKVSGPGTVTFANAAATDTTATFSAAGEYVLRLTANDSALSAQDDVKVTVIAENGAPTVNAGPDQRIDWPTNTATLDGTASDDGLPAGSTLTTTWSKVSGPGTVTFANPAATDTTATFSASGVYVLQLSATDGRATVSDTVTIVVNECPTVTIAPVGVIDWPAATVDLQGTIQDDGLPPGSTPTSTWSFVSGPGSVTFSAPSAAASQATFGAAGSYVVRLTATDGSCSDSEDVTVIVNALPLVDAGADQTIDWPTNTATLDGTASDDGLPPGSTLTTTWAKVSGPGDAAFANPSAVDTNVTVTAPGTYVFSLTATDGRTPSSDTVTVVFNEGPTVGAGLDQLILWPTNTAALDGAANDDGLPPGSTPTTTWSKVSGPGGVVFADAAAVDTTATFSLPGTYVLKLTASDSRQSAEDTIQIVFNEKPVVSAGTDQTILLPAGASLDGAVSDDGLPTNTLTIAWEKISGPGTVTFTAPASEDTIATFSEPGLYELRLNASDGHASNEDLVRVTVLRNEAPVVDAGTEQTITWPANSVALDGTASDDGLPPGSLLATTWTKVSGPGDVTFGNPSAIDTTASFGAFGEYVLGLSATDGELTTSDTVAIHVLSPVVPTLSISDAAIAEGQRDTGDVTLTVTLSRAHDRDVTVLFGTEAETAGAECDYLPRFGSLTFTPGETTKTVAVPVVGELVAEANETFRVVLADPLEAVLGDAVGQVTITNDDAPNQAPSAPADRQPANGANSLGADPTLSWSSSDPDGDALTYDVYFGTAFGLDGQRWSKICPPTSTPMARDASASAYDAPRDRLFVFGGRTASGDTAELWVLDHASGTAGVPTWSLVSTVGGPGARRNAVAAFDAASRRLIVHGGCEGACTSALDETWALDETSGQWSALPPSPAGRRSHAAVYDAAHNALVVFGGTDGGVDSSAVWILSDANGLGTPAWTTLTPAGSAPAARYGATATYDAAHDRLFVFGGRTETDLAFSDLWVLSGVAAGAPTWSSLSAAGTPAARWGHVAAYDPDSQRLVVFGGTGSGVAANTNIVGRELWVLTGLDGVVAPEWHLIAPDGPRPDGRFEAVAGYDPLSGRMTLAFGGNNLAAVSPFADTWVVDGAAGRLPLVSIDQTATSFVSTTTPAADMYLWKIVARDARGAEAASPVWSFRPNAPPTVDVGPDRFVDALTTPVTITLAGIVNDDGKLRAPSFEWAQVSGPMAVLADPTSASTQVTFSELGEYVFRLTVDDGQYTAFDDVRIVLTLFADLTVAAVDVSDIVFDGQTLEISGTASAQIANNGGAPTGGPFSVAFFEDRNGNQTFEPGADLLLGSASSAPLALGGSATVTTDVSGNVLFRGNRIHAFVDSARVISESNEANNYASSAPALPDLIPSFVRKTEDGTNVVFTARIGNAGGLPVGPNLPVSFYDGDPAGAGRLLGMVRTVASLEPGGFEDVVLTLAAGVIARPLWVVADDLGALQGTVAESNETNNAYDSGLCTGGEPAAPEGFTLVAQHTVDISTLQGAYYDPDHNEVAVFEFYSGKGRVLRPDGTPVRNVTAPPTATSALDGAAYDGRQGRALLVTQACVVTEVDPVTMASLAVHSLSRFSVSICAGIAVGADDNVYIASYGTGELVALDRAFTRVVRRINAGTIGVPGIDGVVPVPGTKDRLAALSSTVHRAVIVSHTGSVLAGPAVIGTAPFSGQVTGGVFDAIAGLCVNGHIWICQAYGNKCFDFAPIGGDRNTCTCPCTDDPCTNHAPVVNAGPDQVITLPVRTVSLDGTVTDDGLPVGGTLAFQWSKVSGPGTVTFASETSVDTMATLGGPGIYVLRLTAGDGALTSSADVTIEVRPVPDLTPTSFAAAGLSRNAQTLAISGTAAVTVSNTGFAAAPSFSVVVFEDRDGDAEWNAALDNLLGSAVLPGLAVNESASGSIAVSGTLLFAGNRIFVYVDSDRTVPEDDETNNLADSVRCAVPVVKPFEPQLKWSMNGFSVWSAPLVVDLDGDKKPEIVFADTAARIYALRGDGSGIYWTVNNSLYTVDGRSTLAVGDIDNDGRPEIVGSGTRTWVLEHDGTPKWSVAISAGGNTGGPSLADLDGDGTPEIIVGNKVVNADGTLRWTGTGGSGLANGAGPLSVVADLDMDGAPEVIGGSTAYRANGTVYWKVTVGEGLNAVANFDADAFPEVVLSGVNVGGTPAKQAVFLIEHDGTIKWRADWDSSGPTTQNGAPAVADLDGDGGMDIVVPGNRWLRALRGTDGTTLWQVPMQESSLAAVSASIFDFDGDGAAEIVMTDQIGLAIFRASDGQRLFEYPLGSNAQTEFPTIADVDADGHADIIAPAHNGNAVTGSLPGIYVFTGKDNDWMPARPVWNQYSYRGTNVTDDGRIPAQEKNAWPILNGYHRQGVAGGAASSSCTLTQADLTVSNVELSTGAGGYVLSARIGNGGNHHAPAGVPVTFYDGNPAVDGLRLATTFTSAALAPGSFEDVSVTLPLATTTTSAIWVVADDAGGLRSTVAESNEDNNTFESRFGLAAAEAQPDLIVATLDRTAFAVHPQSLAVSGTLTARVQNLSNTPSSGFDVAFFEDRNGNGTYDAGTDVLVGEQRHADNLPGGTTVAVTATAAGVLLFAGSAIHAFVDSGFEVAESNETNNIRSSGQSSNAPSAVTFDPIIKWSLTSFPVEPTSRFVGGTPAVVDLNGDKVPDVAVITFASTVLGGSGILRAASGSDGQLLFSATAAAHRVMSGTALAAGDIDGDGRPEIVAFNSAGNRLLAFEHDGSFKWQSAPIETVGVGSAPAIADLDGDGAPEIVVGRQVLRNDGTLRWTGTAGRGSSNGNTTVLPVVADLDMDGQAEVIAGNTAYRADGSIYWNKGPAIVDGFAAIANLDTDPFPEVVLGTGGKLAVLEHDGTVKIASLALTGNSFVHTAPPAVSDFEGHGRTGIGVAGLTNLYHVVRTWLSWRRTPTSNQLRGPVAFDFDGDGASEMVHLDNGKLRIHRGWNGSVAFETDVAMALANNIDTAVVVIADVDADSHADMVVPVGAGTAGGLHLYSDPTWVGTRGIWNQHSYHVTNVEDDGRIPAREVPSWQVLNNYRENAFLREATKNAVPDISVSRLQLSSLLAQQTLTVRVGNGGASSAGAGVAVKFYDGNPSLGRLLGTTTTPTPVAVGAFVDVSVAVAAEATSIDTVWVVAEPSRDGDASNNRFDSGVKLNQSPEADAGADQEIEIDPGTATLTATTTDDGLPSDASVTVTWTQVSGAPAVIDSPTSAATVVHVTAVGDYEFKLDATDGVRGDNDTVRVKVHPSNTRPVVNAGADQTITNPPTSTVTLTASATDDGLPVGSSLTYAWSVVDAPGPVVFGVPNALSTTATFDVGGTYRLAFTASDSALTSVPDEVVVTVIAGNRRPVVNAGPDRTITLPSAPITLAATATDDGLPAGVAFQTQWSKVFGPGAVTFGDPKVPATTVTFDMPGTYLLRLKAADSEFVVADDVFVTVQPGEPQGGAPFVDILSPTERTALTQPTAITGTVRSTSLQGWRLEYRRQGDATFVPFATGATTVEAGTLGTLDTTLLLNGLYEVRLVATDTAGRASGDVVFLVVKENFKVGHFSVSFLDLEVPVSGMPMRVTRTYDSRDKSKGDFGFGWRVDVSNVKVSENGILGESFQGYKTPGYFPQYCVQQIKPLVVTLTFNDGRTWEYEPVLTPSCQMMAPIQEVQISYRPAPGSTALGTLQPLDGAYAMVVGSWPDSTFGAVPMQLFNSYGWNLFDPAGYQLVMPDGQKVSIDQVAGVRSIQDLNGNLISIGPGGITHSSGKGIVFKRDSQGRIESITDPNGNAMKYTYDAAGDLVTYADRENNVTKFEYHAFVPHHLEKIIDPLGRAAIRNLYDDSGRLIGHIDADGKKIEYGHQIGARREEVKDRLGNTRIFEYDVRGNVVKEIDPEGNQILRTFDARNNRLTETVPHDPAGTNPPKSKFVYDAKDNMLSSTDPNENKTEYTYDSRNQVLTVKDPRGKTMTNIYDAKGNLLSTTDASGNVTDQTYNAAGNVLSQTRTLAGVPIVTEFKYSGANVAEEKDPLGNVTKYTYDANGNRLTQTRTRTTPTGVETLLTQYQYDRNNRLLETIDPDNTVTKTVYDAVGRQKETYGKRPGQKTTFEYDVAGRLTKVINPDNSTEETTYDAEGRRLTSKDRAGRITGYEYDKNGRPTKTLFPAPEGQAAPFTQNKYDAAGRIAEVVDARGNNTFYEYDDAGRRTKVRAPIGNGNFGVSEFTYDASGNQTTFKDPNGETFTYLYDALNRHTRTEFPDGTFTETGYDALGRRVLERDQAGRVTRFDYDELDRLIKVIDAENGDAKPTTYTYDELGSRLAQTDANGHATRFEYDKLGRQTARILPDGKRESLTHDAAGNTTRRVDFMGRKTTYDYDVNNRLTSRSYDSAPVQSVLFEYFVTGRRKAVTDVRGVTTYAYDERDRLTTMTYPDGRRLEYGWDANGNRRSLKAVVGAQGLTTQYVYDEANRLKDVLDPLDRKSTYGYDPNGNRTSLTQANGTSTSYAYNNLNRLTNLTTIGPAGPIQSYAFTLGSTGNREQIDEHGGVVRKYEYDALYRLKNENVTITGATFSDKWFTYDPVGNRHSQTTTGTSAAAIDYTYDDRDRLVTEGSQAYAWDDNGNLTSKAGEATYTWDLENRLIEVAKAGTVVAHAYDADGNRVQTKVTPPTGPPMTTNYLVDTSGSLSHVVAETDVLGVLLATYVRGTDDLLTVIRPSGSSWTSRWYQADGVGSIRALTDEIGNVTDTYEYDSWGNLLRRTGTDPQSYAFAGEPYDPNIGFQYHRARWMDPRAGIFASVDPFAGDQFDPVTLHKYLYAGADPLNKVDPTGLFLSMELNVGMMIRSTLQTLAISAPLRALHAARELKAGADLGAVAQDFLIGIATDIAVSAVLFGVFAYAPRLIQLGRAGQAVQRAATSPWNADPFTRGRLIERLILGGPGRGVPGPNAAVIDDLFNGVATSVKSIDLTSASYQSASALRGLLSGYARSIASYTFNLGASGPVNQRVLVIAVEEGAATAAQAQLIADFIRRARYIWPELKIAFAAIP